MIAFKNISIGARFDLIDSAHETVRSRVKFELYLLLRYFLVQTNFLPANPIKDNLIGLHKLSNFLQLITFTIIAQVYKSKIFTNKIICKSFNQIFAWGSICVSIPWMSFGKIGHHSYFTKENHKKLAIIVCFLVPTTVTDVELWNNNKH